MSKSAPRSRRALLLGCTILVGGSAAGEVFAQPQTEPAMLGEVIVTAQKREQSLQDVPISVTAVTQEALQANRITNVTDLTTFVPNVAVRVVAGGAGIPGFSMRGLQTVGTAAGQDKSISPYLDGVFIGSSQGSAFELPDLERIEVLRGPQGTLFGRNATGGAINIITRDPSGKFGIRQEVTLGNYEQFRSSTRLELPAWGPLSASISYTHDEREGDIKNLGAGRAWNRTGPRTGQGVAVSPKTLGDEDTDTVFVAVKFEPNDTFKTVYKFDWMENNFTPEGTALVAFTPLQLGAALGGVLQTEFNANPAPIAGGHRPKYVNNSYTVPGYLKVFGHNVTTTIRINDKLSLKNILALRKAHVYSNSQISGIGGLVNVIPAVGPVGQPYVVTESQTDSRSKQWSDELQLNYDSKILTLTMGALYYTGDSTTGPPIGLPASPAFSVYPGGRVPLVARANNLGHAESTAAYVQAEVHVLPQVDVIGGYRITRDNKETTVFLNGVQFDSDYAKTKPSYLVGVNYKPTSDILLYGKYSNGFVSGGSSFGIPYLPETVRSWEGGWKADLLDRRLRFNTALWRAKYRHLQGVTLGRNIGRPELGSVFIDLADVNAKGFEAELTAAPIRAVSLNAGVGYTTTKLLSVNPIIGTLATYRLSLRPKWTANLSGQYETEPLFGDARLVFRADAAWRSKLRLLTNATVPAPYQPILFAPASWIVNSRISLRDIKVARGTFEVAVWARNLTDNDLPVFPINFGYLGSTSYERARTFGIDLIYNY